MKGSTTGNSSFICHLDPFLRTALNREKDKDLYFGVKTGECEIKNSSLFNLLEVKCYCPCWPGVQKMLHAPLIYDLQIIHDGYLSLSAQPPIIKSY